MQIFKFVLYNLTAMLSPLTLYTPNAFVILTLM